MLVLRLLGIHQRNGKLILENCLITLDQLQQHFAASTARSFKLLPPLPNSILPSQPVTAY